MLADGMSPTSLPYCQTMRALDNEIERHNAILAGQLCPCAKRRRLPSMMAKLNKRPKGRPKRDAA